MDLSRVYRVKNEIKWKPDDLNGVRIWSRPDLVIKLPDIRVLHVLSRSLFLVMILITLPSICSIIRGSYVGSLYEAEMDFDVNGFDMTPNLFHDLVDEGLLKAGDRGLLISSDVGDDLIQKFDSLNLNGIDLIIESYLNIDSNNVIGNEAFDFVLSSLKDTNAIDRVLKTGGILISYLSDNPLIQQAPNYKLVYLRRFDHTMVAMRKIGSGNGLSNQSTRKKLCGFTPEEKKAALRGLEDALLEPPRKALAKSSNGSMKVKFLPELLNNSLQDFPRRIFISDGRNGVAEWFHENYPVKHQEFEVFAIKRETDRPHTGVSDWLRNHVREADYVVMKAEEMVVEEMISEKTICLVDELFLECKSRLEDAEEDNSSERAYWQCLALYGKLRGDGFAVHQWWS